MTSPTLISKDAEAYNKTLDEIANEQILLNVLRAKERRPMRVTRVDAIGATRKQDYSSTFPVPLGHKATNVLARGGIGDDAD